MHENRAVVHHEIFFKGEREREKEKKNERMPDA